MNSNKMPKGASSYLSRRNISSSLSQQQQQPHHTVRYQLADNANDKSHSSSSSLISPSSIASSFYQILSSLAILILILLCTVGLITTLSILYLTIRPFSLPTYRRLACTIGAAALLDGMALLLPNTRIYLTGDSDPLSPVGVSVLVCNHVMEGDWWAILMLARCVGLRGSVKPYLQRRHNGNCTSTTSGGSHTNTHTHAHTHNDTPPNNVMDNTDNNHNHSNNYNHNHNNSHGQGSSSMPLSTSAPLLNSALHQHHHGGFKRNLSHQAVGATATNNSPRTTTSTSNTNINININSDNNNTSTTTTTTNRTTRTSTKPTSSLAIRFLHNLLEFPLLSSEHSQNYITDRNDLFTLLRSFASNGAPAPIHLLLFPEGWPEGNDRKSMMSKSIEFAKREGRPQLQHLLLPRTTGFYASLDSLREASPIVYDITMAYRGYEGGERPFACDIGLGTIMKLIRGEMPNEIHIRIKRYSMEEVLSDAQWLDKQWAEKDRVLGKFVRCGNFANIDNRGFCRYRVLDTRGYSIESSITALLRLGLLPFSIPVILILFVPLLWGVAWVWIAHRSFLLFFPGGFNELIGAGNIGDGYNRYGRGRGRGRGTKASTEKVSDSQDDIGNGETDSSAGTPFFPATPFASPTHVASWRSAAPGSSSKDSDSPSATRR